MSFEIDYRYVDVGTIVGIEGDDTRNAVAVAEFGSSDFLVPVSVSKLQFSGINPYIGCIFAAALDSRAESGIQLDPMNLRRMPDVAEYETFDSIEQGL